MSDTSGTLELAPNPEQRRRLATVLVALGPERAAKLLQRFPAPVVEQLVAETAQVERLSPDEVKAALDDFGQEIVARRLMAEGGKSYARDLLTRLLGAERADEILRRIDPEVAQPFRYLGSMEPKVVATLLSGESAGTVAVALAHLEPSEAAAIAKQLPEAFRADVALRVATLEQVPDDVISELDTELRERVEMLTSRPMTKLEGRATLVSMLQSSPRRIERDVLAAIEAQDARLAEQIREELFVFDDIAKLTDKAIQQTLRTVDTGDLAVALKDAGELVRDRMLANVSERARNNLLEEMEFLPTQKPAAVKEARKRIVATVRRLEQEGVIEIARAGGDDDDDE
ncbi:MAG: flagellar motor switch protein FliG [Actinomycetota bacterium]|nr:flagellar motor switch protein FliG [Actinomycetota bacterium]